MKRLALILLLLTSNICSYEFDYNELPPEPKTIDKRSIKPLAWESYGIRETLALLYGKNRLYEKSEDIHIKLPTNTEDLFRQGLRSVVSISTDKKVKSIAILQQKNKERSLVALYYPYGNTVNITLPLKIIHASLNAMKEGLKVTIVIETVNDRLYMYEYPLYYSGHCDQGYDMREYLKELREYLDKNVLRTKYSVDENGTGTFEFKMLHPMVSYREAEKLMVKANFISHINASVKNKKLFDLYTSGYIKRRPIFIMEFPNMKRGENIDFSYSTINGDVTSKEVKPLTNILTKSPSGT